MTTQESLAVAIHHGSAYGRDNLRDTDLTRLAEHWPGLRAVFEEVQYLRDRVEHLQDEVDRLDCDVDVG
jgi:hypothetical protein